MRTQRFSLSTQKRRDCRFGRKRRCVLLLAWETWFPYCGFLPVISHTRDMMQLRKFERGAILHYFSDFPNLTPMREYI